MQTTEINGIGDKIAAELQGLGIETVEQLAAYKGDDPAVIKWVPDARALLATSHSESGNQPSEPETFEFTFLAGLFQNKKFSYRAGDPVFRYGMASVGNINNATLQEKDDPNVDGQKFLLRYAGEWSSAVLPADTYKRFKTALNKSKSITAAPAMNLGAARAGGISANQTSTAAAATKRMKTGCKGCGG